jgi:hypothetical protein
MYSLVLNAPKQQENQKDKKSFRETLATGIGEGYALNKKILSKIQEGCKVILLSKDQKLRAEGILEKLIPTIKTKNHIQRFNIKIKNFKKVEYKDEKLNRNGVNIV